MEKELLSLLKTFKTEAKAKAKAQSKELEGSRVIVDLSFEAFADWLEARAEESK